MKHYNSPMLELNKFSESDVVTTSVGGDNLYDSDKYNDWLPTTND